MPLKVREFERLVKKLRLKTREGRDRLAWFEYEGKVITRTRRSRGSGDLPHSHAIRQQLKLNEDELNAILACTVSHDEYVEILREKNLLL